MAGNLIKAIVTSEVGKFVGGMKQAKKETNLTKSEVLSFITVLDKLINKMIKLTDYTDDYVTSMRILKTTLGETEKTASKFVNTLSGMSGLNETDLNKAVAKFGQLGKSINLDSQYTEKFAENLTILTTKLAILYNTDFSVMSKNVQKAVQGTQTTLKTATGIEANEVNEQALLVEYGIDREVKSLNKAEQEIVRYATILKQVSSQNSVYANGVNSLAWQKQILEGQTKRLSAAIGGLLTPALTGLLTILNAILMVATEVIRAFSSLVGITIGDTSGIESMSGAYDDLEESISNAGGTAKKQLRGFDKLNNITTPSSGGGGNALGIDKSLLKLLDGVDNNFLKIRNKATEIRDIIMEWLGFSKEIDENGNLINWKYNGTNSLLNITLGIVEKIKNVLQGKAFQKTFDIIKQAIEVIINSLQKMSKAWEEVWNNGGAELFENLLNLVAELLYQIAELFEPILPYLEPLGDFLSSILIPRNK